MPRESSADLKKIIGEELNGAPASFSVAVKDLSTGREYLINSKVMPSASLIKIFIMIEAFRQAEEKIIDFNQKIVIPEDKKAGGAGTLYLSPPGTAKTWLELTWLMINQSDNTAANMLIDKLSADSINRTIAALGCKNTALKRKMMDFESLRQGIDNLTSITDMMLILDELYHGRVLTKDLSEKMLDILKSQEDTSKIPAMLSPETIVANKTGELDFIEHDAAIIYGKKTHYIAVIMTENVLDAPLIIQKIAGLSKTIYDFFNS